ncbi:MAG: DoxX family protein, partial [Chloroflexota bacterium]
MLDRDIAILILRVVGLLFIGHGAQKLFGWFGGQGLAGTAQWLGSLGLQPARFWAVVAGLAELLGGIGLALGLFTPIAAA